METLHKKGYQVYIVGGFVRDALLGLEPKDIDLVTDADMRSIVKIFGRKARIIGRRFPIVHVQVGGNDVVEISSFEKPTWTQKIFKGGSSVTELLKADASRRDFKLNALYFQYPKFQLHDPLGARSSFDRKVIELIGQPKERYQEDSVRLLRAIRFQAKLGFTQQKGFDQQVKRFYRVLSKVSGQRLFLEFLKLMQSEHSLNSLNQLQKYRLMNLFIELLPGEQEYYTEFLKAYQQLAIDGSYQSASLLIAGLLWPAIQKDVGGPSGNKKGLVDYFVALAESHLAVHVPRRLLELSASIWLLLLLMRSETLTPSQLANFPGYEKAQFIASFCK
jgi:poly(A) polymerase